METVHCGYSLGLDPRSSYFSGLPTAVFNFSVERHHLLFFVDRLGVPMNLQETTLPELSQSLEMPLSFLPWESICKGLLERVLHDLGVHYGFWTDITREIMWTALTGLRVGHRQLDMSIKLTLVTKEEVEVQDMDEGFIMEAMDEGFIMEDMGEGFIGGYESDPDQALRAVSRGTIEKLQRESCFVRDGDECCSICLEKLNGAGKVIGIPCSHLFHSKCIVEWLKRNNSCPLCRSKVEV